MKQITILAAILVCAAATQAQKLKESDVPAAVRAAFIKNFPDVKGVKWSKESASEFEAEFKNGKLEQSANFDAAGKWMATETEIRTSKLPAAVQASIEKEFSGYEIEEAEKVETPDKGLYYEVHVEKGKSEYNVEISTDGTVLKKEEAKDDDDE